MKSRRNFITLLLTSLAAVITAFLASCGAKPSDAVTEASEEWPPRD